MISKTIINTLACVLKISLLAESTLFRYFEPNPILPGSITEKEIQLARD